MVHSAVLVREQAAVCFVERDEFRIEEVALIEDRGLQEEYSGLEMLFNDQCHMQWTERQCREQGRWQARIDFIEVAPWKHVNGLKMVDQFGFRLISYHVSRSRLPSIVLAQARPVTTATMLTRRVASVQQQQQQTFFFPVPV